jgi:dihydroorotate dehydrogenase (fumarate)
VIASLNGTTTQGWIEHAKAWKQAGRRALELTVYSIPSILEVSGAAIEQQYIDIVREVRSTVGIPISVKLAPFFTALPNLAAGLVRAGVDGLVLFNRFYAPDVDLETLRMTRTLPLSTAAELPLSLVWIAILSRRLRCSFAASRGVESESEVVKYLLAGAHAVMTTSALLRHGPQYVAVMRDGLERWLADNHFDSVDAIRSLKSDAHVDDADAFLRAQYVASLRDYVPGKLVQ